MLALFGLVIPLILGLLFLLGVALLFVAVAEPEAFCASALVFLLAFFGLGVSLCNQIHDVGTIEKAPAIIAVLEHQRETLTAEIEASLKGVSDNPTNVLVNADTPIHTLVSERSAAIKALSVKQLDVINARGNIKLRERGILAWTTWVFPLDEKLEESSNEE